MPWPCCGGRCATVAADQVILGFLGTSGSGKTTLLERLIPELRRRGLAVGLIKHCSRDFEIDHPGKDTYRLKRAGARRVIINNAQLLGLVSEVEGELPFEELARRYFADCDVVLVEGHRTADIPKIVVERQEAPRGLIAPEALEGVVAEVSDLPEARFPEARRFGLDELEPLVEFLLHETPARSGQVAGVVLAGGRSSRLGTDKAQAVFEGATLLERATGLLARVCRELWVIGRKPPGALAALGVRWHLDLVPEVGPLGGLYTALKVADAPRCLVAGCDMPFLSEAVLRQLLAAAEKSSAVVARGPDGQAEPLTAVYSKELLPRLEELLKAGDYKLSHLFDETTHYVEFPERRCFFNVNTPRDWAELER
jgi:molybdopterin-guanine dinucleotide biosynthesis protein MobB